MCFALVGELFGLGAVAVFVSLSRLKLSVSCDLGWELDGGRETDALEARVPLLGFGAREVAKAVVLALGVIVVAGMKGW